MQKITGRCECGAVAYEVSKIRDTVTFCHCSQCRGTSGHYWASTRADLANIRFTAEHGLTWYQSSRKHDVVSAKSADQVFFTSQMAQITSALPQAPLTCQPG